MKKRDIRINHMISILRNLNGASVKDLSKMLDVSEMTVRRDLNTLQANNIISWVHGAAIINPEQKQDEQVYHVLHEKGIMGQQKDRIGRAAARMIAPNDVVIIDIGTTAEKLARYIPMNFPITVLCFTMNVLVEVHKKNVGELVFGGGYYHYNTQLFESPDSINLISKMRANKYFMTAAGVNEQLGITCINQHELPTKTACMESSLEKILMVDSGKFGLVKPAYFANLGQIDTVITDSGISQQWRDILQERGIALEIV